MRVSDAEDQLPHLRPARRNRVLLRRRRYAWCGPAPDETNADVWFDFVFLRDNPRGPHREYWHHVQGCRQWLVVERDTLTHKIGGAVLARDAATEAAS